MNKSLKLDKELAEYRQNFYNIYYSKIIPIFTEFEKERKKKLSWLVICVSILIVIMLSTIIAAIRYCLSDIGEVLFALIPFVVCGGFIWIYLLISSANSDFVEKLKASCMQKVIKAFGKMKWYDQHKLISDDDLSVSQIFARYNHSNSYDSFKGTYKGVDFEIEESCLQHESGSGSRRNTIDVFRGVIIKVPANKTVRGITIVATKGDKNIRNRDVTFGIVLFVIFLQCLRFASYETLPIAIVVGIVIVAIVFLVSKFLSKNSNIVLNEIKLEDPEFSKKYSVYSADQVEGRYMVTPAFMERFKNLQTAFGSKNAKCSFYKDSLIFAISTKKNLFEIGNLFHSIENPKQMTEFFNELSSILALIDYFKLNEKTGL